ncbi:MAG: hypothetical protein ACE5JM_12440 [Armatimonadota bacterium]
MPVAGQRRFNIRSFYGPTYPALPMSVAVGFPELERPVTGALLPAAPPAPEPYMRCSAIIWNKDGNVVAVVQIEDAPGYTVHPGDLVGSYVVEEITQKAVTLRDRETGKRRTVRLESAPAAPEPAAGAAQPQPGGARRPAVGPARPARPARPVPRGRAPVEVRRPPPA